MKFNLSNDFVGGAVAKLLSKFIQKKTGYKINIQLNDLNVEVVDGKAHLHVNADAEMDNNELIKVFKVIGV